MYIEETWRFKIACYIQEAKISSAYVQIILGVRLS